MLRPIVHLGRVGIPLLLVSSLAAQAGPPPYMQIFREREKIGHSAAHRQTEAGWPRAFARAKTANHYLAINAVYGPSQVWFLEPHGTIAELEASNKATEAAPGLSAEIQRLSLADAAHVDGGDALLVHYLADASNGPDINPADMRVWQVLIFRVRPGHEAKFFEAAKLYQSVVQQAKVDAPWATYEVMAGMPGPTYLVFSPHKTLAEIDPAAGNMALIQKAMSAETMKKMGTLSEGFLSIETLVFAPSPEMSYPPDEWGKQDPKFWGRKSPMMARAKPSTVPPNP